MRNVMQYTLGEAAKASGKSKTTLHRAIKSGKVSATRRDDNSYAIDASELHRVFPPVIPERASEQLQRNEVEHQLGTTETLRLQLETAEKERERERQFMQETIADLREDRDRWRQQATALLEDKRVKKRWFHTILGIKGN